MTREGFAIDLFTVWNEGHPGTSHPGPHKKPDGTLKANLVWEDLTRPQCLRWLAVADHLIDNGYVALSDVSSR